MAENKNDNNDDGDKNHYCQKQYIILFYKYHPLSSDETIVELYKQALTNLCYSLKIKQGRILVGCNQYQSEGINGTLSGSYNSILTFVHALTKTTPKESSKDSITTTDDKQSIILNKFWMECDEFYKKANCCDKPLIMDESEFKWSTTTCSTTSSSNQEQLLFPDLNIKIVKELIGTGNVLASIPLDECSKGYLTPKQWHQRMLELNNSQENDNDTILIDCRNTKEYSIGHFNKAIDPQTTTFNQFPNWVNQHQHTLANKKVLMYCTGGIRCEKASAYIRNQIPSVKEVCHLKGGIHKYLDEYHSSNSNGSSQQDSDEDINNNNTTTPVWMGKNFVFDGRIAQDNDNHQSSGGGNPDAITTTTTKESSSMGASVTNKNNNNNNTTSNIIVGSCTYCNKPYDKFDPSCVCTVCREPTLVCLDCRSLKKEYHCISHQHLKTCYFTNLTPFTKQQLQTQFDELQLYINEIAIGKKYKQKRKTLYKQCNKIQMRMDELLLSSEEQEQQEQNKSNDDDDDDDSGGCIETRKNGNHIDIDIDIELKCRNCGEIGCNGRCWGFHGLKRKQALEQQTNNNNKEEKITTISSSLKGTTSQNNNSNVRAGGTKTKDKNNNAHLQEQKRREKESMISDLKQLKLVGEPPSAGRDAITGIRVPMPCTRILQTKTKGKWCGMQLLTVLREEFTELSDLDYLSKIMERGLLRVNNDKIMSLEEAENRRLKNMDVISRIVRWHEPPVHIPSDRILVTKVLIPKILQEEFNITFGGDDGKDALVFVCHKPSSVPVHPAGPYLSNSLTSLVEGQEGLQPRSLIPCHRIDRVTSGLTLCCTNVKVARMIQGRIDEGSVQKQYLAKVIGKFPAKAEGGEEEGRNRFPTVESNGMAKWKWWHQAQKEDGGESTTVLVDAPIETVDPANGIRKITQKGKPSQSLFQVLSYDETSDTSILACTPLTGRSHQLRVHLQYLGFPIVHDVLYGGHSQPGHDSCSSSSGVEQLRKVIEQANNSKNEEDDLKSEILSVQDVAAAKEICPCCNNIDNLSAVFTPAQLLQGGHEICLHAFRYRIPFEKKKKKKQKGKHEQKTTQSSDKGPQNVGIDIEQKEGDEDHSPLAVMDFEVGVPEWAPQSTVADLHWPVASKKDMNL